MEKAKVEKIRRGFCDKISYFLSQKYKKVFSDKGYTNDKIQKEVYRLLTSKNMKTFNFNIELKLIEKQILEKISKSKTVKYEPVEMKKIKDLMRPINKDEYITQTNFHEKESVNELLKDNDGDVNLDVGERKEKETAENRDKRRNVRPLTAKLNDRIKRENLIKDKEADKFNCEFNNYSEESINKRIIKQKQMEQKKYLDEQIKEKAIRNEIDREKEKEVVESETQSNKVEKEKEVENLPDSCNKYEESLNNLKNNFDNLQSQNNIVQMSDNRYPIINNTTPKDSKKILQPDDNEYLQIINNDLMNYHMEEELKRINKRAIYKQFEEENLKSMLNKCKRNYIKPIQEYIKNNEMNNNKNI